MARITDMTGADPITSTMYILDMEGDYIEDMMGLTQANITDLANSLAHSKGDADTLAASYEDIMERLARTTAPFVNSATYNPTDGTAEYSYPTAAIVLLAVFHSATQLPEALPSELEACDADWRSADEATPVVHTFADRDGRKVRLWPTPAATVPAGGTFVFSELRASDISEWLGIPIALEVLSEEMAYPSDHQDMEFATLSLEVARMLKSFMGI